MRAQLLGAVLIIASLARVSSTGQEHAYRNSIDMEFLLIQPGTFTLGRFQPPYAKPPDPNAPWTDWQDNARAGCARLNPDTYSSTGYCPWPRRYFHVYAG